MEVEIRRKTIAVDANGVHNKVFTHRGSHAPYSTTENGGTTTNTPEGQAVTPEYTQLEEQRHKYTVEPIVGYHGQEAARM